MRSRSSDLHDEVRRIPDTLPEALVRDRRHLQADEAAAGLDVHDHLRLGDALPRLPLGIQHVERQFAVIGHGHDLGMRGVRSERHDDAAVRRLIGVRFLVVEDGRRRVLQGLGRHRPVGGSGGRASAAGVGDEQAERPPARTTANSVAASRTIPSRSCTSPYRSVSATDDSDRRHEPRRRGRIHGTTPVPAARPERSHPRGARRDDGRGKCTSRANVRRSSGPQDSGTQDRLGAETPARGTYDARGRHLAAA